MNASRVVLIVLVVGGLVLSGALAATVLAGAAGGAAPRPETAAPVRPSEICCGGGGDDYDLTFDESGLATGTQWTVKVAGVSQSSTTDQITFTETAGTYSYTVEGIPGFSPTPSSGSETISDASKTVDVTYSVTLYDVTFKPSGLTASHKWTVIMPSGKAPAAGGTTSIVFPEPNGTYAYTIDPPADYGASPAAGNVTVNGASVSVKITFTSTVWSVKFVGSGQPSGSTWSVELNTTWSSTTGSTITFSGVYNGYYPYLVSPPTGYFATPHAGTVTVNGAAVTKDIAFAPIPWNVTFVPTGPSNCTPWYVTVTGANSSAQTGSRYVAQHPDGTYTAYFASRNPACSRGAVPFTVSNADLTVDLPFSTTPYAATFNEIGLPGGTSWTIHFQRGGTYTTSGQTIVLEKPDGTYLYTITTADLTYAAPPGNLTIHNLSVNVSVVFQVVKEPVTFEAENFPSGASWSVNLSGTIESSQTSTITFSVPNGSYPFVVTPPQGYLPHPASGTILVSGGTARKILLTSLVLQETDLPSYTCWSAVVAEKNYTSCGTDLAVPVGNGSWGYTITSSGRTPDPGNGTASVQGGVTAVLVSFTLTQYTVSFTTTGLPPGDTWGITLNGTLRTSTSETISFLEQGLSREYSYSVSPPAGYAVYPAAGSLTVGTRALSLSISMGPPNQVAFSGALAGWSWSVTLGGVKESGTGGTIYFEEPSGTFPYRVSPETHSNDGTTHHGYPATKGYGNVTVPGQPVEVTVYFETVTTITFDETGLGAGVAWTVYVNGTEFTGDGTSQVVNVAPYTNETFTVPSVGSNSVNPSSGTVEVGYFPVTQNVTFGYGYAVTFSGAPTGATWTVYVGGVGKNGNGSTIVFEEPNGTFAYSASNALIVEGGRYCVISPTNGQGRFTVDGAAVSVDIEYVHYSCTCDSFHLMCIDDPGGAGRQESRASPTAAAAARRAE